MRLFPIALDLNGRRALVIGADGEVPYTVERLLAAGARVSVVAPGQVDASIERAAQEGRLELHRRPFADGDLAGAAIVFLAPGDDALSRRLYRELADAGRLVCTLDRPEVSSFANPSVVSASGLTMSFSSHGVSPGTIRRIREDLSALFSDPRFARYIEALRRLRESLPRGAERAARMRKATSGFGVEARLRFPAWVERGDEP
ncbi:MULTISPECIES: bifunctional precorrin-2 dehydrogenase/sirohydrochlorin ferrochelatase [Sorangium]|uniref:precorrin-2 dehydrogenase n=1 Tax=Sorangium cellulosum TaxID=56 RepID=A0A4P2QGZ8_SORCE|nr:MULTISPECIES: bifunctional precorrin-2 dehydrogenase/sirohydrochlorin ferrochelatase [Sorangium]AUX28583.1 siroheme synthase [Sorangium cellulosum]WCQ87977.1 Precorrin-2 dehydrogenase [Sorangium sp. Soce836]